MYCGYDRDQTHVSAEVSPMKRNLIRLFALMAVILVMCGSTSAHHGQAVYDENHPIALKGRVTQFAWSNPHCLIYMDVTDSSGILTHWITETVNPGKLVRAGWTKDSVKPGDQITLTLTPAKNGVHIGHFYKLAFADGRTLDIGEECVHCEGNPNFQSAPKQ
jgi:hypothetical protein